MSRSDDRKDEGEPSEPTAAPQTEAGGGFFARRRALKSPNEALQPEAAPPPPPPAKKKKRRDGSLAAFSGFLSFLLIALLAAGFAYVLLQKNLRESGPLTADKVVYIPPGTDVPEIVSTLEREGVIDNPTVFNIELLLEQARGKLKAGEYLFKQNASTREVIDTLVNGRQVLHGVTIPEGLTSEQIVERLRENEFLAGDVREIPAEGTLLPETYKVTRGMARADLIRKMQADQKRLVEQVWAKRSTDVPLRSPLELVTLASIVEKETGRADERSRVAGVFINRLQKRMRLQSDPTIVYGLVGGRGTLGRGILRSEVLKYSPYNTYAIDGLPPGPIANPGRAAMEAVANPSRTQDLYFVADGTGGHVFAESLDQHNRNVTRWRQIEKDSRDKGQAPAADRAQPNEDPTAAPAPTSPGRRGDRGAQVFGALYPARNVSEIGAIDLTPTQAELQRVRPVMPPMAELQVLAAETQAAQVAKSRLTFTPDFSEVGVQVRGVSPDQARGVSPDGDASEMTASTDTYPVSARTLAGQRARAARLGLNPILDGPHMVDEPTPETVAAAAPAGETRKARAFDASEGTPLDPLRNRSWDLNSPKTVPGSVLSYR